MSSPCAACKFLRRKCTPDCVFSPYFPPDQPQKFASVHHVFGRSNVAKLLSALDPAQREYAVESLVYEAEAILWNPVYGCVGYIHFLQQRLKQIQRDLHFAKQELSAYVGPAALGPLLPPHHSPFGMAPASFHQQQVASMLAQYGMDVTNKQTLSREQQQRIEAPQLAAVAAEARGQEMLRNLGVQEKQNEIYPRFSADGRVLGNSSVSAVQMMTDAGVSSPLLGLALVVPQQFDNTSFHIQQQ